jgi:hypothetical protein
MDIKRIDQEVSATFGRSGEKRVGSGDQDFKKILEQLTGNSPASPPDLPAGSEIAAPPAFASYPVPFLNETALPGSVQAQSMEAAEGVLDLLEQYRRSLGDPGMSLKEMDGLVQSLSGKLKGLMGLSESLSPADPLKKIISEVGMVSAVEIEKFKQGRYI